MEKKGLSGRGSEIKPTNRFQALSYERVHEEGIDLDEDAVGKTQFFVEQPKSIINTVPSPDLPFDQSVNPYQGCEHGCSYCYARSSHEYWGFNAGSDFEQKIMVKDDPVALLEKAFRKPKYTPSPIMLSGNTDCYQPAEKTYRRTRAILEVLQKYKHPVAIITKNALIQRDLDVLEPMAKLNLVKVMVTITSLDEGLRRRMEPRTATYTQRLKTIEALSIAGVPVGIMIAPVIPGLTAHEIPAVLKAGKSAGAQFASYTLIRLLGSVQPVFKAWLKQHYPDRFEKVWNQIGEILGGSLDDQTFQKRMKGNGTLAQSIKTTFDWAKRQYSLDQKVQLNTKAFIPPGGRQTKLSF